MQARLLSVMKEDSIKQLVSAALMHARQLSGSARVDTNRLAACRSLCKHFALLRAMVDNLCEHSRGVLHVSKL
ncbi:hypothetical protein DIPPA_20608 [Diplonema papillatum]|nr:hypothetical protein DIPPA_20608 [Diplonema papillatum]